MKSALLLSLCGLVVFGQEFSGGQFPATNPYAAAPPGAAPAGGGLQCGFGGRDLTPLTSPRGFHLTSRVWSYSMNICSKAPSPDCQGMICQYDKPGIKKEATLAAWSPTSPPMWAWIDPKDQKLGVQATFMNGDPCFGSITPRIVTMKFPCTPGKNPHSPVVNSDLGGTCRPPGYVFSFPTCHSCEEGCPEGGFVGAWGRGWMFVFMVCFFAFCYLILGCYWMSHTHETEMFTMDSFPQQEFWFHELPELVKDGIAYTKSFIIGQMEASAEGSGEEEREPFIND